jgi:hypothetical protein
MLLNWIVIGMTLIVVCVTVFCSIITYCDTIIKIAKIRKGIWESK